MQAFSEFISSTTATPNQIEFINLIVQELTQNGLMAPERLWEQPYTNLNSEGPTGIFPQATVVRIVEVLDTIRDRAAA
jgi:type I restriction enzyme R subunit